MIWKEILKRILFLTLISTNKSWKTKSSIINKEKFSNLDIRHASHIFESGQIKPIKPIEREPSEEKNLASEINLNEELIEGDILIKNTPNESKKSRSRRKIINELNYQVNGPTRWPKKIVPYEFDQNFPNDMRILFQEAIDHWHKYTCIRFETFDPNSHNLHRSRLYIEYANICGSLIGYGFDKNKKISKSNVYLGRICTIGNIIHELGHTIGFRHEQSRTDRDQHIVINSAFLKPEYASQYDKMVDSQPDYYGVPYDLNSIMHYGSGGGAISALDSNRNFLMGQRDHLSFLDIQMANAAYQCSEHCIKKKKCMNGGFLNKFCNCFCPDGFSGSYCEKINTDINYTVLSIGLKELDDSFTCSFSFNNYCNWINDKARSTLDWIFNKPELNGFTETQHYFSKTDVKLGPQNGDHNGNKNGSYIYINSMRKIGANSNGILSTPPIYTSSRSEICLKFWYNMFHGFNSSGFSIKIGSLSVSLRFQNGKSKKLWQKTGNQGNEWKFEQIDFTIEPMISSVYFEGILDGQSYGDICIDDIVLVKSKCNNELIFGDWSEWSQCSVKCGKGVKYRYRTCRGNDELCSENKFESKECDETSCSTNSQNIKPFSFESPKRSKCSYNCNSFRNRTRKCLNPHLKKCDLDNEKGNSESSNCHNCKNKRNILEKGIINMIKNISTQEVKEGILSEWSEWSSCYGMRTICKNGVQIRTKTCLEPPCKDEPKEVRDCKANLDFDLKEFCKDQYSKIDLSLKCVYGNKSKNNSCNKIKTHNYNATGNVNLINLSESKNILSILIDDSKNENEEFINLIIEPNNNNTNNSICFELFVGNEIEISYLSFFSLIGDKIQNKIEKIRFKKYPETRLNHYLFDFFPKKNLYLMIRSQIKSKKNFKNKRGLLYFKSIFASNQSCQTEFYEDSNETQDLEVDISFTEKKVISKISLEIDNQIRKFQDSENMHCGGVFDLTQINKITISSPSYPYQYPANAKCSYLLKSPLGTKINLKIVDLDLEKSKSNVCIDSLEFRYFHLGQPGPLYCGTFSFENQFKLKSYNNFFMVIFRSDWIQSSNRRGFRLDFDFSYF